MPRLILCSMLLFSLVGRLHADVVINEVDYEDDYSNSSSEPTPFGSLELGNTIVNGVIISTDFDPDPDIFTFTIDAGRALDSIRLLSIDGSRHFFGLDDGNTSVDPNTGNGQQLLIATLVGGSDVGVNLLNLSSSQQLFGGQGVAAPLGPGDYTVWIQENNEGFYGYSIELRTSAVSIPEPSSFIAFAVVCGGALVRRRPRDFIRRSRSAR